MTFKDKELNKKAKYKAGIFDDRELQDSDLSRIEDIFISNVDTKGNVINTDLSELPLLKNLKSLDLKGFLLTDETASIINEIEGLEHLTFYGCNSARAFKIELERLKTLILNHCSIADYSGVIMPENVIIDDAEKVDIRTFLQTDRTQHLTIRNATILSSMGLSRLNGLKSITIDGSQLDDLSVIDALHQKQIDVKYEENTHYHLI